MAALNRADALIFDLQDNRGGYANMVVFLASYLFDHPEYMFNPRDPITEQTWTRSPVAGSLLVDESLQFVSRGDRSQPQTGCQLPPERNHVADENLLDTACARVALSQVFRRKLFWVLYAFGLLFFFMFFFGQYLLAWTESQMDEQVVTVGVFRTEPPQFVQLLRKSLRIDGSGEMYRNFFRFQASMVVVILAMARFVIRAIRSLFRGAQRELHVSATS